MFFGKFLAAIEDLQKVHKLSSNKIYGSFALYAMKLLASAQRFYVPAVHNVIEGKLIEWDLIRLPYPTIALLSECAIVDEDTGSLMMTIATENPNRYGPLIPPLPDEGAIYLLSLVLTPGVGWLLHPMVSCMIGPEKGSLGFRRNANTITSLTHVFKRDPILEMADDSNNILNLCTMLSLHNVKTREEQPSESLAKSRKIRGKEPLPNYHVIVVDNEAWDRPLSKTDHEHLTRSHMRRGHIRRLDEARRVWVRSTYVHGRLPGFVDKEYRLESHHAD